MCFRVKKIPPSNKLTQNHMLVWSEEKDFEHLVCAVYVQYPLLAIMKIVQDIFWLPVNLSLLVRLLHFALSLMLRPGIWTEGGWRVIAQAAKTRWIEEVATFQKGQWWGQVKIQKRTQRRMCEHTPARYWRSLTPFWGLWWSYYWYLLKFLASSRVEWVGISHFCFSILRLGTLMFCGQQPILFAFRTTVGLQNPRLDPVTCRGPEVFTITTEPS